MDGEGPGIMMLRDSNSVFNMTVEWHTWCFEMSVGLAASSVMKGDERGCGMAIIAAVTLSVVKQLRGPVLWDVSIYSQ